MGGAIHSILHNPICLLILSMGGFWLLVNAIKKIYKKFLSNSKKLKKLFQGLKNFFLPNKGVRSFRDFKHYLPHRLKLKLNSVQSYLHINLSDTDSVVKQTQYDYFKNQFYPGYQPLDHERYALDDKHFIYEIDQNATQGLHDGVIRRHWKKVFKKGLPTIIVSVDLEELDNEKLAQVVRKHIDLLQKVKRRKLPLYIHLTGLEHSKDGQGLVAYFKNSQHSLFALRSESGEKGLMGLFESRIDQEHKAIVNKMSAKVGGLHSVLGLDFLSRKIKGLTPLISLLEYENQVVVTPNVTGVFLERYSAHTPGVIALTRSPRRFYLSRGRITGLMMVLICLGLFSVAYRQTNELLQNAQSTAKTIGSELSNGQITNHAFSSSMNTVATTFNSELTSGVMTQFYPKELIIKSLHRTIAEQIYSNQILPLIQQSDNAYQIAYLLMIVHANHVPGMDQFVERYAPVFSALSGLSVYDIKQFLVYDKANEKVRLTGDAVDSVPMTDAQTLYDNFKSQLAAISSNSRVTVEDVRTFYKGAYYEYAGQILLQVSLMKYFDNLKPLLSSDEKSFFDHMIEMQGKENSLSLIQKHLKLVENVEDPPKFDAPDVHSFGALIGLIDDILKQQPAAKEEKVFAWATGTITKAKWHDMMVRAEINSLMAAYLHNQNLSFGDDAVQTQVHSVDAKNQLESDTSIDSDSYSASYVQNILIADVAAYQRLLKALQAKGVPTYELTQIYQSAINNYTKNYVAYYQHQIQSFHYSAQSVADLEVLLEQLSGADSALGNLVENININTQFSSKLTGKYHFLETISQAFSGYHALGNTMKGGSHSSGLGGQTYLQAYMNILNTVDEQINNAAQSGALNGVMDILGDQAMAIYLQTSASFMKSANQLLEHAGVPAMQRQPFMDIFALMYRFGEPALKARIEQQWARYIEPVIQSAMTQFPFDLSSTKEISPQQLTTIFAPKTGRFWQIFQDHIAPYLILKNGEWQAHMVHYAPKLNVSDIVQQVDQFERLSTLLWHKDDTPKAMQVNVMALPFVTDKVSAHYLQMTYLSVDGQSVKGINNQPVEQTITYKWWDSGTASVGYVLENGKSYEQSKEGHWALYKLIKGAHLDKGSYAWQIGPQNMQAWVKYSLPGLPLSTNHAVTQQLK